MKLASSGSEAPPMARPALPMLPASSRNVDSPVADRKHIHRVGKRIAVINPKDYSMSDAVAIMTQAMQPPQPVAA